MDGFPVRGSDGQVLMGLAVCWGSRDAFYVSLQQEQSAGKDADQSRYAASANSTFLSSPLSAAAQASAPVWLPHPWMMTWR